MPNIIIKEIDETSAGTQASSTDIAFVPGFAETNSNVYIFDEPGKMPYTEGGSATALKGHVPSDDETFDTIKEDGSNFQYPAFAVNIVDKKCWKCTTEASGGTPAVWSEIDYVAPKPENVPTLCTTIDEFELNFGKLPYKFAYGFNLSDSDYVVEETNVSRRKLPDSSFSPMPYAYLYQLNDYEKSYIYAKELIALGLPVYYDNIVERDTNGRKKLPSVSTLYDKLGDEIDLLDDINEYSIKYITSGAYPTFEYSGSVDIVSKMNTIASERGDCVAIIDHTNIPNRALIGDGSVYNSIQTNSNKFGEFATMFTPWANYSVVRQGSDVPASQVMPASFGYLVSLAKSIRTNANWLAVAGVTRGRVPYINDLNTTNVLSNKIADEYQKRTGTSINAITNIKPYGLTIWGNRTLKNNITNLTATSFLNTRNMVSDIKKIVYTTAKSLMFEQDSVVLWVNFKAGITPTLDKMVSGQGLSGYKIIRGTTTEKAKVVANIKLYPMYAVEDFDITITISDDEVSIA